MAFGLSNKRFSPIGIDFGADSVKLLQIVASDPPQMVAAAAMQIPESARKDPMQRFAFLGDALKQLLRTAPFKGRKAICSIPAFQMLVHHLEVPCVEPAEMDQQVGLVLQQRMNIDPLRMVVRHFPVDEVRREGATRQEVICMAIARDKVLRYLDTARRAKLDVVGMHAEPTTVLRAFNHLWQRKGEEQRTTCFIDMGAATTKVIIAHGQHMAFAKAIHAAGDHFTRERAVAEHLSFDEARALRLSECARPGSPAKAAKQPAQFVAAPAMAAVAAGPADDDATDHRAAESTVSAPAGKQNATRHGDAPSSEAMTCIIDELQLSVRYHQSLFPDRPIEKLVFLGGESHHVSNCQRIARALRIGAQLGDPLARLVHLNQDGKPIGVDMRQPQPGWAVPLGLCMSEANLGG